jgi:subtilisin family serine protease
LIDTGIAIRAVPGAGPIEQQGFAPGGVRAAAHGTAVASLLVSRQGAAPGASLLVADVYGAGPTGGSAEAVSRALAWMAERGVPVVNISLVGPPNALVRAAVRAFCARGAILVAAVGNDGPAAPPLYPAAYEGVVGVTGVDRRRRVLLEAGRGPQVDFAAAGTDITAATPPGRWAPVRGTSYAAPVVAVRLALLLDAPDPARARAAVATLERGALDLGAPGRDPVFGAGLITAP